MFFTFGDFWGENVSIPKYTDVQEYIGVKITYFFFGGYNIGYTLLNND